MADQAVRIKCPNLACRRILAVPIGARGKVVRCSGCGKNIRIPMTSKPTPAKPSDMEASIE